MHDFVSVHFNLLFLYKGVLRILVYKKQRRKLTEINILKVRIMHKFNYTSGFCWSVQAAPCILKSD